MKINWEAISAIGQCAGAFTAAIAIYFAARPLRTKVIYKTIKTIEGLEKNVIINIGQVQTNIIYFGLKLPKRNNCYISATSFLRKCDLPIILQVGESIDFNDYLQEHDNYVSKKSKIKISEVIFFQNEHGKVFYKKISIYRRLLRWLWWTFGEYNYNFEKN
jgi:hypothetical protein